MPCEGKRSAAWSAFVALSYTSTESHAQVMHQPQNANPNRSPYRAQGANQGPNPIQNQNYPQPARRPLRVPVPPMNQGNNRQVTSRMQAQPHAMALRTRTPPMQQRVGSPQQVLQQQQQPPPQQQQQRPSLIQEQQDLVAPTPTPPTQQQSFQNQQQLQQQEQLIQEQQRHLEQTQLQLEQQQFPQQESSEQNFQPASTSQSVQQPSMLIQQQQHLDQSQQRPHNGNHQGNLLAQSAKPKQQHGSNQVAQGQVYDAQTGYSHQGVDQHPYFERPQPTYEQQPAAVNGQNVNLAQAGAAQNVVASANAQQYQGGQGGVNGGANSNLGGSADLSSGGLMGGNDDAGLMGGAGSNIGGALMDMFGNTPDSALLGAIPNFGNLGHPAENKVTAPVQNVQQQVQYAKPVPAGKQQQQQQGQVQVNKGQVPVNVEVQPGSSDEQSVSEPAQGAEDEGAGETSRSQAQATDVAQTSYGEQPQAQQAGSAAAQNQATVDQPAAPINKNVNTNHGPEPAKKRIIRRVVTHHEKQQDNITTDWNPPKLTRVFRQVSQDDPPVSTTTTADIHTTEPYATDVNVTPTPETTSSGPGVFAAAWASMTKAGNYAEDTLYRMLPLLRHLLYITFWFIISYVVVMMLVVGSYQLYQHFRSKKVRSTAFSTQIPGGQRKATLAVPIEKDTGSLSPRLMFTPRDMRTQMMARAEILRNAQETAAFERCSRGISTGPGEDEGADLLY